MELAVCFIILIMFPFTVVNAADYQVDALIAFKDALDDPAGVLKNWTRHSPNPCSWQHITCDSANNVTEVDLGNKSLPGSLVPELGNLSALEYLWLYSNELNGSIPTELGQLTNLLSLNLQNNNLIGSIPRELGNLKNLTWLLLNDNNLSEEVPFPDPLTNLFSNMKVWNFSGNPYLCGNLTNPDNPCSH